MRRLVYLCDWLPPDFGAVGQCSLAFAQRYARDDGLDVVLVGLSSGSAFRSSEALGRGRLTVIKVPAKPYDRSRWRKRLWWTLRTDLRLIGAAFKELWRCDTILFTGAPPFLLHLLVPLNMLLRKRLIYRITDFYPECLIAALGRAPWALRLLYRWTCLLRRRRVDQFQVLGRDQERRLRDIGVPADRIVVKRDPSPVTITGPEQPLAAPSEIAGFIVLLYSGNFGVAHEVDTFLEGYRAHHCRGRGRVALWLNAIGSGADRLETACRSSMLPVARTCPLPFQLLPRLLVTPAAHLITLRPQFTGFVLPSKVYGCIASGRAILYVGDRASDVHGLCDRAPGIPLYRQVDIGDPSGVATALADIADLTALKRALERVRVNSGAYTNGHDHGARATVASGKALAEPRRELETQGVRARY